MDKFRVDIANCYGIKKLEHEFDFSQGDTKIIYAPNGTMKSSFANTLDDFSKGVMSKDKIYTDSIPLRKINSELGEEVNIDSIFVIKPFEQSFKTDRMSTLLVNPQLKEEYDVIYSEISKELDVLVKNLKSAAAIKKDIIKIFCEAFGESEKNFITLLLKIELEVNSTTESIYENIKYNEIFDAKIINFIKSKEFKSYISEYIKKYDELISESKVFKKGFNHNNAATIQKELKDNGYFDANHSVILNIDDSKIEINTSTELLQKFSEEQNRILENEELKAIFNEIDKKLTNSQLKGFRDLLVARPEILPELRDLATLNKNLWITYLSKNKEQFNVVINKYKVGQQKLKDIIEKAKNESTKWEKVVDIFNGRFHVPYTVAIENKEDAIIKETTPNIKYYFGENEEEKHSVDENLLWNILSQGERRALYLLNIIFEIESRKEANLETVFIIDDIADSFDYKNKYAIIEYLKEIANDPLFKMIILTHNFDFLRTVQERICGGQKYTNTFMAVKEPDKVTLERWDYGYISNPLKFWKMHLNDEYNLIASITFARNLAEYLGDDENKLALTSILHLMKNTKRITITDIEKIYKSIFHDIEEINIENKDRKIYDLIMESSNNILSQECEAVNLEQKIVLSIATRLLAEEYMLLKISEEETRDDWGNNQYAKLHKRIKKMHNIPEDSLEVLERINIMTPENIHLNSFMFEPLLDLSNEHLKQLFKDIKTIILKEELVTQ